MLPLLLLLLTSQVPAVPGEGTLVSFCKQGRVTACQELLKTDPEKYAEIQAELAKAALRLEVFRAAEEGAREKEDAEADEPSEQATSAASGEPPNCDGQIHHIIKPRDPRFKTQATDKESHCGYQKWHRDVDDEVIRWLEENSAATPEQFMRKLREIYNRKEMRERFPNGF